jgi:hypothetical protein
VSSEKHWTTPESHPAHEAVLEALDGSGGREGRGVEMHRGASSATEDPPVACDDSSCLVRKVDVIPRFEFATRSLREGPWSPNDFCKRSMASIDKCCDERLRTWHVSPRIPEATTPLRLPKSNFQHSNVEVGKLHDLSLHALWTRVWYQIALLTSSQLSRALRSGADGEPGRLHLVYRPRSGRTVSLATAPRLRPRGATAAPSASMNDTIGRCGRGCDSARTDRMLLRMRSPPYPQLLGWDVHARMPHELRLRCMRSGTEGRF